MKPKMGCSNAAQLFVVANSGALTQISTFRSSLSSGIWFFSRDEDAHYNLVVFFKGFSVIFFLTEKMACFVADVCYLSKQWEYVTWLGAHKCFLTFPGIFFTFPDIFLGSLDNIWVLVLISVNQRWLNGASRTLSSQVSLWLLLECLNCEGRNGFRWL